MLNHHSRKIFLKQSHQETYDLLVVGGGITGAGVARDAASRGLKVLVVEAQDFASGTSSRSSKLVHGGIRYLENFEFSLVHEALMERKHLLEIAPHMVHPLRFMIPIYKGSRVGLFKMEAGMLLYDLLSFFEAPQLHEVHRKMSTESKEPLLKKHELTGSVIYSDAYMEDDRLVIETLRSALSFGAKAVNYTSASALVFKDDHVECQLRDELTGDLSFVKAKHVVGCVGPWTDIFAQENLKPWTPVLRPTKGVHLVFSRSRVPVHQAIVMGVEERIVFVIPREDIVIVGTTDTDFKENPTDVLVDAKDVDYLLQVTNQYFPDLKLQKADVLSCYSGVRPLVRDQSSSEGKTSREHEIFEHSEQITLVAGGKYTTYRAMSEEIVDSVLRAFTFDKKMALKKSQTLLPLNPSATIEKIYRLELQSKRIAEDFGVSEECVKYLIRRRGEESLTILNLMKSHPNESEDEKLWMSEAQFCIENEMCMHLVDFYWRRTPLFLFKKGNGLEFLEKVAPVFAKALKWSDTETQNQMAQLKKTVALETKCLE